MPAFKDITGMKFGKLLVLGIERANGKPMKALCRCDCGTERLFLAGNLTRKERGVRSCGCARPKPQKGSNNPNYKHGHGSYRNGKYGSGTHRIWRGIKDRCLNPRNSAYKYYGKRGIGICERWMSFENFLADMGERPEGMSLDRIDNDGDYEPGNCRWATSTQQTRNARSNVMNFYFGELMCVSEAAEKFGLNYGMLKARIDFGESPEDAVTRPTNVRRKDWGSHT